jgi:hypothetical protein
MKPGDLFQAKNKDLVGSLAAMQRAAKMAREIAVKTNTAIVLHKDGKTVRITADELREQGYR